MGAILAPMYMVWSSTRSGTNRRRGREWQRHAVTGREALVDHVESAPDTVARREAITKVVPASSSAMRITSSIRQAAPARPCPSPGWVIAVFLAVAARSSAAGTGYHTLTNKPGPQACRQPFLGGLSTR